jgi:hypothetical protein
MWWSICWCSGRMSVAVLHSVYCIDLPEYVPIQWQKRWLQRTFQNPLRWCFVHCRCRWGEGQSEILSHVSVNFEDWKILPLFKHKVFLCSLHIFGEKKHPNLKNWPKVLFLVCYLWQWKNIFFFCEPTGTMCVGLWHVSRKAILKYEFNWSVYKT